MATSTQLAPARAVTSPVALWHLLSLDAPTVAALWTWFLARANHLRLPPVAPLAMAMAVWMLYAADRLLDARLSESAQRPAAIPHELEARHFFHHRHRRGFLLAMACAAVALAALLPRLDPAALRLDLGEGALLAAWFLILHATHSAHRLPKELAVGLFFSAATFIPTLAREPALRWTLLPGALLFAALCSLNCLYIYAWEHDERARKKPSTVHPTTRLALRHLLALTLLEVVAAITLSLVSHLQAWPVAAACALSSALLMTLDRLRHRLPATTLRAAADLALLTPLALLPFVR